MKKLIHFVLLLIIFAACEGPAGPEGPIGPQGADGADGVNIESFVFEYAFSFEEPDYSVLLEYPEGFEALESDVTLVYLLWGQTNEGKDVWRALPQTIFTNDGLLQYNYDFTQNDAVVFLSAEFDASLLLPEDTDDWIARVVVIPGQFLNGGRMSAIDFTDYEAVAAAMDFSDAPVQVQVDKEHLRRK